MDAPAILVDGGGLTPRKELMLPTPPRLPGKLPFEDGIARGVDRLLSIVEKDPILNGLNRIVERVPVVPERQFMTPWGNYKTPEFYVPKLSPARFDARQREAFKAAVMNDIASLVEKVPGLGAAAGPIADSMEDTAMAKIADTLTPEENKYFRSYDKVDPLSTIAMIRTMVRTQKER